MTEINDKAQLDIAAADDTDAVTSDTPEETVNTPEVDETFELSAAKMREHGMSETAINQFHHLYDVWRHEEASSWIREDDIEPLGHVPSFHDVYETINHDKAVDAFAKTAFLKLNGGLGTSMGLDKAKSLLPVRRHKAKQMRFIDIIIGQVLTARTRLNVELPLTFMNSFHTSADTMKVLKHHRKFSQHDVPMEIIQHQEPKLVAATGEPVSYPANPELEWCPPGHGDLYPALLGSGWLDRLLADGVKYAFVSNSDNLGAQLDMNFLRWFAESGAPFVMEVTRRTEADRKGGHLAVRKSDGQLILREVAQCPDEDIPEFQNFSRHRYFNTNTLWIRLDALKEILDANGGVLPLPMIRNKKTLNPRDPESAPVYQLETAMGAGIECFPGARAVNVPRSRFFPVKTTSDLFLLRSDAIAVDEHGNVALAPERQGNTPVVDLDSKLYKLVDSLDGLGLPSLIGMDKLTLRGRFHFQDGAVLRGTLLMENDSDETKEILPGVYAGA